MKRLALLVAAGLLAAGTAQAAVFQVSPVTIDVQSGGGAAVMTLTNGSDVPIVLQVRTFRWSQADGKDVLDPTADIIASPPIIKLAPGASHIVRVVRPSETRATGEEAYRLWIDQVPDPQNQPGQVKLYLRESIPVFFSGSAVTTHDLRWTLERKGPAWTIAARNLGTRRERISALEIKDAAGVTLYRQEGLVGYVLAGSSMRWPVSFNHAPTGEVVVSASSGSGPLRANAAITQTP
jgi:fimbrial chaperone protein